MISLNSLLYFQPALNISVNANVRTLFREYKQISAGNVFE